MANTSSCLERTSAAWRDQARADARHDRTVLVHDGVPPNQLCCDTTLRQMPDASWVILQLALGHTEPVPPNRICMSRSTDEGHTWSPLTPVDLARLSHPGS